MAPLDYTEEVGFWLNIPRIRMQRTVEHLTAILYSKSNDQLPEEWFDAIALCPGQSIEMQWQSMKKRATSQAMSQVK